MIYNDSLYGEFELPAIAQELVQTPDMKRLKCISQDVLPACMLPWSVPSRYEHCVGAMRLMMEVIRNNVFSEPQSMLLVVAALMHDAGNPPLSHLSEPFLKRLLGMDGESYLKKQVGQETAAILRHYGLHLPEIVECVTGQHYRLSKVLHGSMDVDNLDNVARYWAAMNKGQQRYNALMIAGSFCYVMPFWFLKQECLQETRKWQDTREDVYGVIYGEPHLGAAMMVQRALQLAFSAHEIGEDFFGLTDCQALKYLQGCNVDAACLVNKAVAKDWYSPVFSVETENPNAKMRDICADAESRWKIADDICKKHDLPSCAVCVYAGQGKDRRNICLPFTGMCRADGSALPPIYRLKVYLDPDFSQKCGQIIDMMKKMVN